MRFPSINGRYVSVKTFLKKLYVEFCIGVEKQRLKCKVKNGAHANRHLMNAEKSSGWL